MKLIIGVVASSQVKAHTLTYKIPWGVGVKVCVCSLWLTGDLSRLFRSLCAADKHQQTLQSQLGTKQVRWMDKQTQRTNTKLNFSISVLFNSLYCNTACIFCFNCASRQFTLPHIHTQHFRINRINHLYLISFFPFFSFLSTVSSITANYKTFTVFISRPVFGCIAE